MDGFGENGWQNSNDSENVQDSNVVNTCANTNASDNLVDNVNVTTNVENDNVITQAEDNGSIGHEVVNVDKSEVDTFTSEKGGSAYYDRPTGGVYSGQRYSSGEPGRQQYTYMNGGVWQNEVSNSNDAINQTTSTGRVPVGIEAANRVKEKKQIKEKKHTNFWKKFFATIGLGIVFGLTAGVAMFFVNQVSGSQDVVTPAFEEEAEGPIKEIEPVEAPSKDSAIIEQEPESEVKAPTTVVTDVTEVVETVMPAVVSITGDYVVTGQNFFGQIYSQQTSGSGSGIIVAQTEDQLLIATNNHVVEDAESLEVQFIDEATAPARVKGTAQDMDLAVIIVDISDLKPSTKNAIAVAKMGDSDSLKVGEPAIAIGNALGYGQSVTAGVISAIGRTLDMEDGTTATGLIQTDAAINPGNSGGALVNIRGEVIGINSSKIGGATVDGVGFAIPISNAEPILSDIVTSTERVKVASAKQGYLGISGVTVTEEASTMYGIPVGVQVRNVYEGTGAEAGGILTGDVITKLGHSNIDTMEKLREELTFYSIGEEVDVTISRFEDGSYVEKTMTIKLIGEADMPDQ